MPPVAAFDPGRNVGYALVAEDGALLTRAVLTLDEIGTIELPADVRVVIGRGTGHADLRRALSARGWTVHEIDEQGTSEEGRALWRRTVPARGAARWLPPGLRSPDVPIDDFAAWAIALRFLGLPSPGR